MPATRISEDISYRIELLRVTCILCVVCVHTPSPIDVGQEFSSGTVEAVYDFLTYAVFRSATPTLSVISGYLLFKSFSLSRYHHIVLKKFSTILLPAVIWATGMALLLFAAQGAGLIERRIFDLAGGDPFVFADAIFGISHLPFNGPIYFLYDIFLCIIISPVLYFILKYLPWTGCLILILFWVSGGSSALWLRGDILVGFYAGGLISLEEVDLAISKRNAILIIATFLVCCLGVAWHAVIVPQARLEQSIAIELAFLRILGPLAMWSYASLMAKTEMARRLRRFGGMALFVFCSHEPLIRLLGRGYFGMTGGHAPAYYPLFYIAAPAAVILFAWTAKMVLERVSPRSLALLSGGRLGRSGRPAVVGALEATGTAGHPAL